MNPHDETIPNLRGGPPAWLLFVLGPLFVVLTVAAGVVITLARMPDGNQFHEVTRDVAAIKQDVAVGRSRQESADQLANERNEYLKAQLRELLAAQRRK